MKYSISTAVVVFLMLMTALSANAQYMNLGNVSQSESDAKPQRWFAGGMIGGSFSNYGGSFEIAPLVGYKVTPKLAVGTRVTYIYSSYKNQYTGTRYNLNDYGASLFARYQFFKSFFGQAEYEALSLELPSYVLAPGESSRQWINSLFVGGGLLQPIGGRGFTSIAILFNLLETEKSSYVYSNPIIRIGFGVGF